MATTSIRKLLISKIATFSGGGGGGTYVSANSAEVTQNATVAGSIAAGTAAWRITNIGPAVATVNGASLEIGATVAGQAYADPATLTMYRCPQIAYNPGTGGALLIAYKN